MKKSEMYKYAQCAVLETDIRNVHKLEILRVLMEDEDMALYCEEQESNQAQAVNSDEAV